MVGAFQVKAPQVKGEVLGTVQVAAKPGGIDRARWPDRGGHAQGMI